jgi:hypothetical protein
LDRLKLHIDLDALKRISVLSQGLPHYTHLLGLHASREAIDSDVERITLAIVDKAITKALTGVNESITSAWHSATLSARKDNLFADVLLACALAETDGLGFFAAQNVRQTLREITGKPYEIWSFAQHLNDFCDPKRGPILQKTGTKRRFKYRFTNPLMQPYVIMNGMATKKINSQLLNKISRQRSDLL